MPATLVSIDTHTRDQTDREKRLRDELRDTRAAVYKALHEEFDLENWPAWDAMLRAEDRYTSLVEGLVLRAERAVANLLARFPEDSEERRAAVAVLYGRRARVRDCNLLTTNEARLVEAYRECDPKGRSMLQALLERIAATSATAAVQAKGGAS